MLIQLYNESINYAKFPPKLGVSKIKESDKKARRFDTFFVFKLLALKYNIHVPVLYFKDIFNSSDKDKYLIIFHPNGIDTEINCWISQRITRRDRDGKPFYHPAFLCVYDRVKMRKSIGS